MIARNSYNKSWLYDQIALLKFPKFDVFKIIYYVKKCKITETSRNTDTLGMKTATNIDF